MTPAPSDGSAALGPSRVTVLTDFGTADGYVAAMTGVLAAAAPGAAIEHASHDIPPGDIAGAALALSRYAFLYPVHTVHLIVVDPGVGTDRRAIAARVDGRYFVAPDNGVLTRVLSGRTVEIVVIDEGAAARAAARSLGRPTDDAPVNERASAAPSATFHGRDLFAPAAARLARGEALSSLGEPLIGDPVLLVPPEPERTAEGVRGEVVQVDRFGNLITNIPADWLADLDRDADVSVLASPTGTAVSVGPVRRVYGDVESGAPVALIGSIDVLEVSVRDGSAADRLGAVRGAAVLVR